MNFVSSPYSQRLRRLPENTGSPTKARSGQRKGLRLDYPSPCPFHRVITNYTHSFSDPDCGLSKSHADPNFLCSIGLNFATKSGEGDQDCRLEDEGETGGCGIQNTAGGEARGGEWEEYGSFSMVEDLGRPQISLLGVVGELAIRLRAENGRCVVMRFSVVGLNRVRSEPWTWVFTW